MSPMPTPRTVTRVAQFFRDRKTPRRGWLDRLRRYRALWMAVSALATGTGCASFIALIVVVVVVIMTVFTGVVSMSSVVHRVPTVGYTVHGQDYAVEKNLSDEDKKKVAQDFHDARQLWTDLAREEPAFTRCIGDAPPVLERKETLFIVTPEERQAIIDYHRAQREYDRDLAAWKAQVNRYNAQVDRYNKAVERARRLHQDPRKVPKPTQPRPQAAPPPLPKVEGGLPSWAATRAQRAGLSASTDLPLELLSTTPSPLPAGIPIMGGDGKALDEVNTLINQVPKGTNTNAARAFLLVAFAGGVTNWKHFATVANFYDFPLDTLTYDSAEDLARRFFEPGADLTPYRKAVASALISLSVEDVLDGSPGRAVEEFDQCMNASIRSK